MVERILFDGPILFLVLCEISCICAFSAAKNKGEKSRILIKIVAALALIAIVRILDFWLVDADNASTALEAPMCILAAAVYAHYLLKFSWKETLYCTLWTYIITEIAAQIILPLAGGLGNDGTWKGSLFLILKLALYLLGISVTVMLIYRYLGRELLSRNHYHVGRQKILMSVLIACLYTMASNYQFIFWLLGDEPSEGSNLIAAFRLAAGVGSLFFLYMQNSIEKQQAAEKETDTIRRLWEKSEEQYRSSQENINLINRKCHDLKYQVEALRRLKDEKELDAQLKELEQAVLIYDSAVETGNAVLDTVLTEKCLYCEMHQIQMICMADASELEFVGKVDLYTIFANAIDNAIEYVQQLEDPQRRIIKVSVYREKDLLMIRIKNPCERQLKFAEGLPVSTKEDSEKHGFGLKSIRYTAEKYGGQMRCECANHAFVLQILLPVTGKQEEIRG